MKKIKAIVSIAMIISMLCTMFSGLGNVFASDEALTPQDTTEIKVQNIQDGVILHAFCWSYAEIEKNLENIAKAGYTTIQTSPVQQPKDMCASTNISGQWWKLYQPASLSIAQRSWLGTKEELTSLCTAAEKYGIKILCDIVSNHLGASSDSMVAHYGLAQETETYEPIIWNGNGFTRDNPYFHQDFNLAADSNAAAVTQRLSSGCPDLNTGSDYIQQKVSDLLKECIDCGVDGFRFDAAKHIETPDDGTCASDYWPTVLGAADEYAKSKGQDIYYYGEILNTPGVGREYSSYTKYGLTITDNIASRQILAGITGKNPAGAVLGTYNVGEAKNALLWAESHDTYYNESATTSISNKDIVKMWAVAASRKDATALYFPRPTSMKMGEIAVDATYKSVPVAEINRFHNECVGEDERLGYNDDFAYIARGQKGVVVIDVTGNTKNAVIEGTGLADGQYKDMITGNEFTITNGVLSGTIGESGVAVVTQGKTRPTVYADKESGEFNGETITLKLTLTNATEGEFSLNGSAPVKFTDKTITANGGEPSDFTHSTIKIGKGFEYGETITLTLKARDGEQETTTVYEYVKKKAPTSGIYVMLKKSAAVLNGIPWTAPVYCYIYDEWNDDGSKSNDVYSNAAWPGEEMEYDEVNDCYYLEIQDNYCVKSKSGSTDDPVPSDFNLAASNQTSVIFSDSSAKSGSLGGKSEGKQYPLGSSTGLPVQGKTRILEKLSRAQWMASDIIPGYKSRVFATEVNIDGTIIIPSYMIGDTNYDGVININDATAIQYFLADIKNLECGINVADANGDGRVSIMDVTYIQRYIAKMDNYGEVSEVVQGDEGDIPTTTKPTEPPTTEPEVPAETYTAYVSSGLTWLEDSGCSIYLYDKATGESYIMVKDPEKYPNVYTAEVPVSCTDVLIYRALGEVLDPETAENAYNKQNTTLSKTNNCYYWTSGESGHAAPYEEQQKPTTGLERVYVDNSAAKWSEVYIFGWGCGLDNTAYLMTNIQGTDIWYYDLPESIPDGTETFLFKNTADTWDKQTADVKIQLPNNCYKLSTENKGVGLWSVY